MNTLYFCQIDRRDFGDLLSSEGLSRLNLKSARNLASLLQPSLSGQSVVAVWSQDPKIGMNLPDLLMCQDETENDWAAWITTFGAKIRPFSAFTRLISRSGLENLVTWTRTPTLDRLTWPVAGLILGEVLAASRLPDKSLEALPANACESTLSFAIFRAAATYSTFHRWPQLVEAWDFVRQTTRQQPRLIESAMVARVCATIMAATNLSDGHTLLASDDIDVVQACHEVITSNLPPTSLSIVPRFVSVEERMHGPREDRVVAFSELVRAIGDRPASPTSAELTSFMLGYLASRIAPGTIQHSGVLGPVMHRYSTALLWYGFCAGLGESDAVSGNVVARRRPNLDLPATARRITRDLLRPEPILGPPNCDIGFLELLALSKTGGDPLAGLIRTTQGTATIELAPAVWTVVNVPSKLGSEGSMRTARDRDILAAMGEYIDRLREAYSDLVGNDSWEGGQRPLFPPKRKKP